MKIRADLLKISTNGQTADGRQAEPEQQQVDRVIKTEAPMGLHGAAPAGAIPTEIVKYAGTASEVAQGVAHNCSTCVAEGTLVFADGNLVPIESAVAAGVQQTFVGGEWRDVSARVFTGRKEIVEIMTTHGAKFRVTPDHRVMTDRGWVAAADLRQSFRPGGIADNRDQLVGPIEFQMSKQDAISREDALLAGMLVGDGWSAYRHGTVFGAGFCFAEDMREAWQPLLDYAGERLGSSEKPHTMKRPPVAPSALVPCISPQPMNVIVWRTKEARQLGAWLSKEHVPRELWASTPGAIGAYLRGLFSTDGAIALHPNPRAHFCQTSETLIAEVRMLLRSLGIYSTCHVAIRAPQYKNLYTLTIARHSSLLRFIESVGFVDAHRRLPLEAAVMARRGKGRESPERVRSVAMCGVANVYDISVPGPESFLANGILVHNCINFDNPTFVALINKADDPTGPIEQRRAVNEIRAGLLQTNNAKLGEMHLGQDGDMDVEQALRACGFCKALTEHYKEPIGVHPASRCPQDVCGPSAPYGFYKAKNVEAARIAGTAYDKVMNTAAGKLVVTK